MTTYSELMTTTILNIKIHAASWKQVISCISNWAENHHSKIVNLCNVHVLVSAKYDPVLRYALAKADLALPDGAPIAWIMRKRLWPEQQRLSGPDLMWLLLAEAERRNLSVFFLGSTPKTLAQLKQKILQTYPDLKIAGTQSPPFTSDKGDAVQEAYDVALINKSRAQIVFIGLGCPKQEKWIARQHKHIKAVMIGVGAAFDFHAGTLQRAPQPWQQAGLEWLHRLMQEPVRLLPRYVFTNSVFLMYVMNEIRKKI